MTKVSKPTPELFPRTNYLFERMAHHTGQWATEIADKGDDSVREAAAHEAKATARLGSAAANAALSTTEAVAGTVDALDSLGHLAAATALAGAGTLGWVVDGIASAGLFIAKNLARGFAGLADLFTGKLKDSKTTTAREIAADPDAARFCEKMFGKAAEQLQKSGDAMSASWNSYVNAASLAASSVGNAAMVARHGAAVIGNVIESGLNYYTAGFMKLTELGARVAGFAVKSAEKGLVGARDAAVLMARIVAAAATAGKDGTVDVEDQVKAFEDELKQLEAAAS